MIVTKLRIGDANTMMAEGGIQAADKENDSPVQHYLDCFGGGHFAAKPELVKRLVMEAPDAIKWPNSWPVPQRRRSRMAKQTKKTEKPTLPPQEALYQAISLCRKAGALTMGFDAVEDACVKGKAWLVMTASDASAKTVQRLNYAVVTSWM